MAIPLHALNDRFWRMLSVRWQRQPYASGSHLTGGRFNPQGMAALYLSADHATAIAEFHQDLVHPGTLAGYDVEALAIADLTDGATLAAAKVDAATLACDWRTIFAIERKTPPSWRLAERLLADGVEGAIFPSFQRAEGRNLVLWRWHPRGEAGEGAALALLDPAAELAS